MHSKVLPFIFMALTALVPASKAADGSGISPAKALALHDAAAMAQDKCFKEMYRDPNAYGLCIRDLSRAQAAQSMEQLGVLYFGFVGALSYMRVSQAGATPLASEFLKSFRSLQKNTGISDADLCASVPGNCELRIGQTLAMERSAPTAPAKSLIPVCKAGVCRIEGQ
jgi:hypothetical protein